ncbi:MAG: cytochrome ubiquinol oxidase subunit I [Planctomycetota bacterium]
MPDLLAARAQMALSLAFHILFAVAGMAMPVLMVLAEVRARRGDAASAELARRWARGTAILFAVGAVSGTVLSFELGLLWPRFMAHAGPLVGVPFGLEGFAFFTEAIFLGIYLYGRERVPPAMHLFSAVAVAVSGLTSGVFVVAVNAWMNTPVGFTLADGGLVDVDPWAAFAAPAFPTQAIHTALSAYGSIAFVVLGIHALCLLRDPDSVLHHRAVQMALGLALVTTPLQIVSGDFAAKHVAAHQPAKLAAAEGLFTTQARAPLCIGGVPDADARQMRWAFEIPGGLSFLAHGDVDAEVVGLDAIPRADWPPVAVTHVAFQIMVACGTAMLALVVWGAWLRLRRRPLARARGFLRAAVLAAPLGLLAVEAGWTVTEVGRQPWIVHGFLRTADAVTPMPKLALPLAAFTSLYLLLGVVVVTMLRRHVFATTRAERVVE